MIREFDLESGLIVKYYGTRHGVVREAAQDGVMRRVAPRTPPASLDTNIPMPHDVRQWDFTSRFNADSNASVTPQIRNPPASLTRSALALWWNIEILLDEGDCYLWTVTHGDKGRIPDSWFGNMFRNFTKYLRDAGRAGKIPKDWKGVRVFEPHPNGHGLHAHMILRNKLKHSVIADCAKRAGLGFVFVRSRKCDIGSAHYLCKYLNKAKELCGVRRWACLGNFDGCKKNEIVYDSPRIRRIKGWRDYYLVKGMHRYAAYLMAVQTVEEEDRTALHGQVVRCGLPA